MQEASCRGHLEGASGGGIMGGGVMDIWETSGGIWEASGGIWETSGDIWEASGPLPPLNIIPYEEYPCPPPPVPHHAFRPRRPQIYASR